MPTPKTDRVSGSGERIHALDGLRGVLSVAIFCFHWFFGAPDYWPEFVRLPVAQGYRAVCVFFALSGFLFALRYSRLLLNGSLRAARFLAQRLLRLWPVYCVLLVLLVIVPGRPEGMLPKDTWGYIALFTLTQAFFPQYVLQGLTTAWTLTLELCFALCAPLLARWLAGQTARSVVLRILALSAATFAAAVLAGAAGAPAGHFLQYTPFGRLPDFLMGVCAGWLLVMARDRQAVPYTAPGWLALSLPGMLGLAALSHAWQAHDDSIAGRAIGIGFAACASALMYSLAGGARPLLWLDRLASSPPLRALGRLSFVLFLIQLTEPVQWVYWVGLGALSQEQLVLRVVLTLAFALALSTVLVVLIERPLNALAARLLR